MSREIKFRAWDENNKQFADYEDVEECLSCQNRDGWKSSDGMGCCFGINAVEILADCIIEQYTGLTDKNGKEIYEGDIIKAKIDGLWQTGAHTVSKGKATWNLEVVYNDIRYMDVFHILGSKNQPDRIYYLFDEQISDLEIIGNVHENPELIGGEE